VEQYCRASCRSRRGRVSRTGGHDSRDCASARRNGAAGARESGPRRDSRRRDATRRLGLGLGLATHGYLDTVPGRLARTAVLSACARRATDKLIARRPLRVLLVPGTAQCSLSPPPIRLVPHVTMLQLQNKPLETTTTTTSPGNPSPSRPELSPQPPLAHQSPPATFEHGSID
jgi:hypothetical protein